jgi:hypothetical protein
VINDWIGVIMHLATTWQKNNDNIALINGELLSITTHA